MTEVERKQLLWQKKFLVKLTKVRSAVKMGKRNAGSRLNELKVTLAIRSLTYHGWIGPRPLYFDVWSSK